MATTRSAAQRPASARRPAAKRAQASSAAAAPAAEATLAGDVFNLDAVAREAEGERFQFQAGGRLWYLHGPEELDWLKHSGAAFAARGGDVRPFLRQLLGEQYDDFVELPIKLGQVNALIGQWQDFYGVKLPE